MRSPNRDTSNHTPENQSLEIHLDLTLPRTQQHLLTGLEQWQQLGLLTDAQIQLIAQTLSQRLPLRPAESRSFVPSPSPAPTPKPPSPIARATRAFVAEMSVVWLLFLGVFLVVVSSAVLAATQWSLFPPVGQYGVLLVYTLGFWGASQWTGRQGKLQTTARMLAIATLLLFPINVWMIDALGLLSQPLGLILAILSLLGLSYVAFRLLDSATLRIPFLLLGWLHLGWAGFSSWPLLATYVGTVGTTAWLGYQRRIAGSAQQPPVHSDQPALKTEPATSGAPTTRPDTTSRTVVLISLLILLGRSLLLAQVPVEQLGLAFGLCGALLVWLINNRLSTATGGLLLFAGWAITVDQSPPLQALGVSGLASALLWQRLRQYWRRRDLLMLLGVGVQAYWLLWFLLPWEMREGFLNGLSALSSTSVTGQSWAGVALMPTVAAVLLLAQRLQGWQQPRLTKVSKGVAVAIGIGLTMLSLDNSLMLAANLTGSVGLLLWQMRSHPRLLNIAHGIGLTALATWIYNGFSDLNATEWGQVGLVTLTVEWGLSLVLRQTRWRRSTWYGSVAIALLSYTALFYDYFTALSTTPPRVWLWVPMALTLLANHPRALKPHQAVGLTMTALVLHSPFLAEPMVGLLLDGDWSAVDVPVSFALGTLCMALNSRRYPRDLTALFTVGSGLVALTSGWIWLTDDLSSTLLLVWAVEIVGLWALQRGLGRRDGALSRLYNRAMHGWSGALLIALYGCLSLVTVITYLVPTDTDQTVANNSLFTVGLTLAGLGVALWQRSTNARWWGAAVGTGLFAAMSVYALTPPTGALYSTLAVVMLALGLVTQLAGDGWTRWQQRPYLSSWHAIPITYAATGWGLGHGPIGQSLTLTATTGLYTWAAALVLLGVGRRRAEWQTVSYVGLVGVSLGAYELLVYRLLQASGGQPGDGLTLLAGLAVGIAGCDRILSRWLLPYLRVSTQGLQTVSHLHWLLGSGFTLMAVLAGLSATGSWLWIAVSLLLAAYALAMGNQRWTTASAWFTHEGWTWLGWAEALLIVAYARFELFAHLTILLNWAGLIACGLGFALYRLPWTRWGWPARPARWLGLGLPLLTLGVTLAQVKTQNLLLVGAFYAWVAQRLDRIRLSYLSVLLLDWAMLRFLTQQDWITALWVGTTVGLSVLYVAEVEPRLQPTSLRAQRHALRLLGSGLMAATALYQTEVSQSLLSFAGLALLMGLGLMVAGTALRVRAFLYVGLGLFVAQTLRILWQLVSTDALLLWAIGILLGIVFIWLAATFESRRTQMSDLLSQWSAMLDSWA